MTQGEYLDSVENIPFHLQAAPLARYMHQVSLQYVHLRAGDFLIPDKNPGVWLRANPLFSPWYAETLLSFSLVPLGTCLCAEKPSMDAIFGAWDIGDIPMSPEKNTAESWC